MLRRMSDTQATSGAPARPPLTTRERWATAGLGLVMVAVVPFVVTGLFRLGLPTLVVLLLCVLAGGALLAVPRRGTWLALGWAIGCVLYATVFVFVLWQLGQGLANFD